MRVRHIIFFTFLFLISFYGCEEVGQPIEKIRESIGNVPEFSIILEDMKEEGNFFTLFYHKYRIVKQDSDITTDWTVVPESFYREHQLFLGMVISGKVEGMELETIAPIGYQFAGNRRYGYWRESPDGGSFWEFYGEYAVLQKIVGALSDIDLEDYNLYKKAKQNKSPYFGKKNQYGTGGLRTKLYHADFYIRKKKHDLTTSYSIKERVLRRVRLSNQNIYERPGVSENE